MPNVALSLRTRREFLMCFTLALQSCGSVTGWMDSQSSPTLGYSVDRILPVVKNYQIISISCTSAVTGRPMRKGAEAERYEPRRPD
jgi:hypothetical protein